MSDRTNAGYTIINAVTVGKGEIVLGERTNANKEKQYVTWECNNGSYYYGHYIENIFDALKDFGQRVADKAECIAVLTKTNNDITENEMNDNKRR